ncbi:hypothetical protein WJX72_002930 [[Myrmecia] bisecta]|uniref:Uncharacterized protein n=1 Tax=[Myrmecia] bisecta TaxID=41462 RepID=A0AAW1QPP5_9CHLO
MLSEWHGATAGVKTPPNHRSNCLPSAHLPSIGCLYTLPQATFEDTLKEQALAKIHSLMHKAGNQARAYCTILAHFSLPYPMMPVVDKSVNSS